MGTYRRRPTECEAMQYTGPNVTELIVWTAGDVFVHENVLSLRVRQHGDEIVPLQIGTWIIKETTEGFYPCREDVFTASYEEV